MYICNYIYIIIHIHLHIYIYIYVICVFVLLVLGEQTMILYIYIYVYIVNMTIPHEHMYIDCYAVKSYIDGIITFFSLLSMCSRISMADASALTRITLRPFNIALKSFTRKSLMLVVIF